MKDRLGYRVDEIAEMLGMSISAVRRAISDGSIPSTRIGHSAIIPAWWIQDRFTRPET